MPIHPDPIPSPYRPDPGPPPRWGRCLTVAVVTGALVGTTICGLVAWSDAAERTPDRWDDLGVDLIALALGVVATPMIALVGLKLTRLRNWAGSALIGLGLAAWFMTVLGDATHATGLGSVGWRWLVAIPAFLLPASVFTAWEVAEVAADPEVLPTAPATTTPEGWR